MAMESACTHRDDPQRMVVTANIDMTRVSERFGVKPRIGATPSPRAEGS